jgi:hypothetical protein
MMRRELSEGNMSVMNGTIATALYRCRAPRVLSIGLQPYKKSIWKCFAWRLLIGHPSY